MLAIWPLGPLPFLNWAWTSGSSWFTYCWSQAWRILNITLLTLTLTLTLLQLCGSFNFLWHCLSLGLEWKLTFSSWVFKICWHIEYSTFTASSLRIWNSSAGITSPPLVLFIVMLPKAHLNWHSRKSGSKWVITLSWLLRSFLYSFVYSCQLFLIAYASVRSILFLSFIERIFVWNVPLVSLIFLKRLLVFSILLFSSISFHWSLRKAFLSLLAILCNSAFRWVFLSFCPLSLASLLFSAILRPPQTTILPFFIFFWGGWSWSLPPMSQTSVHSFSGTLSIRSNPLNLFVTSTV